MVERVGLTLGEAAKQAGISKTTLHRAIRNGKISAEKIEVSGEYRVDPAELARVYPRAQVEHPGTGSVERPVTGGETLRVKRLEEMIGWLSETVSNLRADKEDLRRDKDRLLALVEEQAAQIKLLTPPATPAAAPEPVSEPLAPETPQDRRGWLARLLGGD